ncbi:MAG: family ATPase [Flavipsychrobacter sp.]|jgi:uncharacterized protein involved in exopolysaccharide biosynthesis/Mrp family chromosome partitioning ATPase|nr:family ATPase [Flavipsychrobacter sp.]
MELLNFLKSLKRYRAVLILVPLVTAIASYIIAKKLPDKYVSNARLTSSIADRSQQLVNDNSQPDSRVSEEFDNLLQTITMDKILDQVSYKLMIHDLENNSAFRKSAKSLASMSQTEKATTLQAFNALYTEKRTLNPLNSNEKSMHKLLKSMHYDKESLRKQLSAWRMDNSQYINLEFKSENPQLSAFVLNTLSSEFIDYYTTVHTANRSRSVKYLDSLVRVKQGELIAQNELLKQYKIDNGILNIDDQAKTIYEQIADMETKKGTAEKDMVAYSVALRNINNKFSPDNRKYLESSMATINSEIVKTKDQINVLNDAYVQSGFNEKYKARIDTLQKKLTSQIYTQTDNYAYNPNVAKENLVTQKLSLEISKDLAQNSVQTINNEIGKLKGNLQRLVPNLATIQAYQAKIDVTNKEYLDVLQKYNQASLEASYSVPVRLVEKAVPGDPVPGKKILLVAFSTIASLVLCLMVCFAMFYFDRSIQTSEQLHSSIDIPVIGTLNRINGEALNLHDLWDDKVPDAGNAVFKNSLRCIRHEIENEIQDGSVLAVTSIKEGEGKTFLAMSLAYAFSKVNKRVLLIDGNFMHPDISNTIDAPFFIEKFLNDNGGTYATVNDAISIIGNKGGDNSLLELSTTENIKEFFAALKSVFNVIIVETSALDSINKANAKEWISFADKVAVVFESGGQINATAGQHVQYLKQLGSRLSGMVLNKVVQTPVPAKINYNLLIAQPKPQAVAYS